MKTAVCPRAHLITSPEPLKEGTNMQALCGAQVPQARFLFMWLDFKSDPLPLFSTRICQKCNGQFLTTPVCFGPDRRAGWLYLYGILDCQSYLSLLKGEEPL